MPIRRDNTSKMIQPRFTNLLRPSRCFFRTIVSALAVSSAGRADNPLVVFSDSFGAATSPSAGNRTIWGSNHSFFGGLASYDYSYSGNSLLFDVSAGASPMPVTPGGDPWGGIAYSAYGDGIVRIRYEGFPMLDLSAGDMAVSLIGNADANVVSLPPSATATTSIAVRLWSVDGGSSSASRVNMSVTGEWTVNGPQFIGNADLRRIRQIDIEMSCSANAFSSDTLPSGFSSANLVGTLTGFNVVPAPTGAFAALIAAGLLRGRRRR